LWIHDAAAQVIAGTPEDKLIQRISTETRSEAKLQMLLDFENGFPQSKALPDVYLMIIDVYRQKDDRAKVIEYGEKTLKLDQNNVTAMMALSRNYALERRNLERAVMLAEQAVSILEKMKAQSTPPRLTDAQWKDYLQNTESAARSILDYARAVKGR
jgi:tetratricopeptide (TPR) repeat protein